MDGRTFIRRGFNVISQRCGQCRFVTGFHHQRIHNGGPQVATIIAQEVRQCTDFRLQALCCTACFIEGLTAVCLHLPRHTQRGFRMAGIMF